MKPQDLLARLEAGYEYDPMYGELCNERDRLAAENTKLREENERFIIKLNAEHIVRQNVESENDKLRELVRDMWFADYAGHFSTLPEHQEHQATVWQRMCELGIEVDA